MIMSSILNRAAALLVAVCLTVTSRAGAQSPTAMAGPLNNGGIIKLFGANNSFISKAEIKSIDKSNKELTSMPLVFSMLDGRIRMEVDLNDMKSAERPDPAFLYSRQLGMDKVIAVIRPDKKDDLVIYPKTSAYAEVAMTKEEEDDIKKKYTIKQTSVGKETVNGHPCVKHEVTLTGEKGDKQSLLVWNATDLKDFPVQIHILGGDDVIVMSFQDVKLIKPEARLFERPEGLTRYETAEKLVRALVAKSTTGKN